MVKFYRAPNPHTQSTGDTVKQFKCNTQAIRHYTGNSPLIKKKWKRCHAFKTPYFVHNRY